VLDGTVEEGSLTTKALNDIARRMDAYKETHGDIAVLRFPPMNYDDRMLGLSYIQIAEAFRELALRREGLFE
jgi:NAD(P)H-dependent FMN reductase